jgi:hypothetical protein
LEYNIKHEKLLTKRLKSSTIVNCNENKKLIEVINKMKDNKVYLTDEGFLELEEELNELKNVKRPEVIKALKEARALGDLSENADYDAARAEQAQVEGRIQELEKIMENSQQWKILIWNLKMVYMPCSHQMVQGKRH